MLATYFSNFDFSQAGEIGLILFFLIFLCVTIWTFTRSRGDIGQWADIPFEHQSDRKTPSDLTQNRP